jgi:ribonuclease HI
LALIRRLKTVTVYTDGACQGNPGPGGWGVVLLYGSRRRELNGYEPATTNNRMELTAAVRALEALTEPCEVYLYTDSLYLMKGLREWLPRWKQNGWRTAAKAPVKNQQLWEELDLQVARHQVEWRWVKGHSGDAGNERADRLANEAIAAAGSTTDASGLVSAPEC